MALFMGGFLLAIGLGTLVLTLFAGALIAIGVVALVAVWPELRRSLGEWNRRLRSRGHTTAAALLPLSLQARSHAASGMRRLRSRGQTNAASLLPLWQQVRSHAEREARHAFRSSVRFGAWARRQASALARNAVESGSRRGRELVQAARSTTIRTPSRPPRTDALREALRLNAAGTQHRRNGLFDEAAECHGRALEILRGLDDPRAVALTKSNLALALSHAGDNDQAVGLFEEAAATLRELGAHEDGARVLANLGLAHRRQGRRDEGDDVLQLALSNLSPASSAYHTIEAELRRAS